jgi:hypothetical protein
MTSSEQMSPAPASNQAPAPEPATPAVNPPSEERGTTVTRDQADQIINELKSIKQNIFWLLLVAGFFAARSFFFHY